MTIVHDDLFQMSSAIVQSILSTADMTAITIHTINWRQLYIYIKKMTNTCQYKILSKLILYDHVIVYTVPTDGSTQKLWPFNILEKFFGEK